MAVGKSRCIGLDVTDPTASDRADVSSRGGLAYSPPAMTPAFG